jgi:hypothetical protein
MPTDQPRIDTRDLLELLDEAKRLAPFYVPEWNADDDETGTALLRIFLHMVQEVTRRLNEVPRKNLIAFLDMLGVKLVPAQPARVALTFQPAAGGPDVLIPRLTQAESSPTEEREAFAFETERNILATTAALTDLYSVVPEMDRISGHSQQLNNEDFEVFAGQNEQEHALYLGHHDLFNVANGAQVQLTITPFSDQLLDQGSVLWQYYGTECKDGDAVESLGWHDLDPSGETEIILSKEGAWEIVPHEINGIETRWIRCVVRGNIGSEALRVLSNLQIDTIRSRTAPGGDGIVPDMLFNNDVPLKLPPGTYPFSKYPRPLGTFYIASQEAFSKKGAKITLQMQITRKTTAVNILEAAEKEFHDKTPPPEVDTGDVPEEDLALSWEYWDGNGWTLIKDLTDNTCGATSNLTFGGEISFECPGDMELTSVVGQENYWIRVRIVSGDYGREKFIPDDEGTWRPNQDDIDPPVIDSLRIDYTFGSESDLDFCLIHNNLAFQDVMQKSRTENELFNPFQFIADEHQALYLGFDKPLLKGPISIFFSLEQQKYPDADRPRVQWYYYAEVGRWARLEILDGTDNLTQSGTVELLAPPDFMSTSCFGIERYWLKTVDMEDRFSTSDISNSPAPKVKGIYLNSTWATQAATIDNELLGSSDGTQFQTFQVVQTPVLSEIIRVNEKGRISEDEKHVLIETYGEQTVSEVVDTFGEVTEIWIRWQRVDDFFGSTPRSRHYIINPVSGEIQFGNGISGMIPPAGTDNIRATYQSGGGKAGNVNASEIQTLNSSIAFVDEVSNPEAAGSGSDTETVDEALGRGTQILRNRGQAVTAEDYEWLAKEAAPDIARVKCLPNFDGRGGVEFGWVTVVIVPESGQQKPVPSPLLLRRVREYLQQRCSSTVSSAKRLQVIGPEFIKASVAADIYPVSINLAPQAQKVAMQSLREFLHPLTGGSTGDGWEFGRMVCFSDLYALMEGIAEIDHVENVSVTLESDDFVMTATSQQSLDIPVVPYALIYSGDHDLTARLLTE